MSDLDKNADNMNELVKNSTDAIIILKQFWRW